MIKRHQQGFSLLELLVCLAIMAIAVFPLLLAKEQSYVDAIDAKLARTCRNHIQRLISEAAFDLKTGNRRTGTLEDYDFPMIRYEIECTAIDLSTELEDASERNDGQNNQDDWTRDDSLFDEMDGNTRRDEEEENAFLTDEEEEMQIDPKYKYRYIKLRMTYPLGDGEEADEKEILVETYLPPLPELDEGPFGGPMDQVPPNSGQ